jgi:hypothetical protein
VVKLLHALTSRVWLQRLFFVCPLLFPTSAVSLHDGSSPLSRIQYAISCPQGYNTLFGVSQGTFRFAAGVTFATATISVADTSALFESIACSVTFVSGTQRGDLAISPTSNVMQVIVTAYQNNPFGVFNLNLTRLAAVQMPLASNAAFVVPIDRTVSNIGEARLQLMVQNDPGNQLSFNPTVLFAAGQWGISVPVSVVAPQSPQPVTQFVFVLSLTSTIEAGTTVGASLGPASQWTGTLEAVGAPAGVFALTTRNVTATVGLPVRLTVSRSGSSTGAVTVRYTVAGPSAATLNWTDSGNGAVQFASGQTTATIVLVLSNSTLPTLEQQVCVRVCVRVCVCVSVCPFLVNNSRLCTHTHTHTHTHTVALILAAQMTVTLVNTSTADAFLGTRQTCAVTVGPNNLPYGRFGLTLSSEAGAGAGAAAGRVAVDRTAGGSVSVGVVRSGGLFGTVTVGLVVTGNATAGADYSLASASVVFGPGQQTGTATLEIRDDGQPSLAETAVVRIGSVQPGPGVLAGAASGAESGAAVTVVLLAANGVYGVFELVGPANSTVAAGPTPVVNMTVRRRGGTLGAVRVSYGQSNPGAVAGLDFALVQGGRPTTAPTAFVDFAPGQTR